MNNEEGLDQKTIDELLNTASKELPETELNTPPVEATENQEGSPPETSASPSVSTIADTTESVKKTSPIKKLSKKKIILLVFILFTCVIAIGGFLGYKIAHSTTEAKSPLEKIIQKGITFEDKNFVVNAGRGDKEIVNAFLEAGMPVNTIRPLDGWSPLMAASFYKQTDIVKLLLDKQATVDLQDIYGKTALMQATAMGAEDIVVILLESGANPNLQDNSGRTALMEAYFKKHAKIAEILKSFGAIPPIKKNEPLKSPPPQPKLNKDLPSASVSPTVSEESRLSMNKAGFIKVGMTLDEIQKKYPSLTVSDKYFDGNKKTIATIYLKDPNAPSLQLELSSGKLKLVSTISVYDEQFFTDKNITARSSVGDIRNQYTINDIKIINNSLFLVVKSMKMLFELDVEKASLSAEWLKTGNPSSVPSDITIKRIVIY